MKRRNIEKSRKLRKNQTDAERKMWSILRNRQLHGVKFRRQFSIGRFILDFYSPEYKLGIEADGGGHYKDEERVRDELRTRELSELGVEILRFTDLDILNHMEGVYQVILKNIENKKNPLTLTLSPVGRGRRIRR
ncbi:endonuclease domain-containing protein [candidate division TA06 bacterium]|nr:endonuclease domain-containing protein [candidate division TA06 bacterium]